MRIFVGVLGAVALVGFAHAAQAQQNYGDSVAPAFRGRIIYDGAMQGEATVADTGNRVNGHFGGVVLNFTPTRKVEVHGSVHAEIEFDKGNVSGYYAITSDQRGVSQRIDFKGQLNGQMCQGVSTQGYQQNLTFTAQIFATNLTVPNIMMKVQANRTQFVDYAERDRQAAAARAEEAAELARRQAAFAAYLQGLKPAARLRATRFTQILEIDSHAWLLNNLDPYSVHNVRLAGTLSNGAQILYGEYTINGGQQGWMMAKVRGDSVSCVEVFDFVGICRALGHPPSHAIAVGIIASMLSDDDSSSRRRDRGNPYIDYKKAGVYHPVYNPDQAH